MTTPPHALVTGAAGGIGRAFATALAQAGTSVTLADLDLDGARAILQTLPGQGHRAVALDVADAAAWARLAEETPTLDLLVHNAGLTVHGPFEAHGSDDHHRIVGVNLLGPMHGTSALLPVLRRSPRGHIVYISSMAALFPVPLQSTYAATKSGLRQLAATHRLELAPLGVGVTTVLPGTIATPFLANATSHHEASSTWMARQMAWGGTSPDRVAAAALKAVRRNRAEVRVGLDCHAMALTRWLIPPLVPALLGATWRRVAERFEATR